MNDPLFILISMMIGATIGGITNHLAIKMLFHPRKEWRWAGIRVPFTPGLIPKRKEEIGRSLGKVVGDYLVTSHGLVGMLRKPEFRDKLENKLTSIVTEWTSKEGSLEQLAHMYWPSEQIVEAKDRMAFWLRGKSLNGLMWLWEQQGWSEATLSKLIPDWTEERKQEFVRQGVDVLVAEIKQEIASPNGDRMLRHVTGRLLEEAGGFLGTLAGVFMDEDKINQKVRSAVLAQIDSPAVRNLIAGFMHRKINQLEAMNLSSLIEMLTKREASGWLLEKAESLLRWDDWLDRFSAMPLSELLGAQREWLVSRIPQATEHALKFFEANVERVIKTIQLPKLVEEQVGEFPIDRLEHIILSVSGKEFRAITWLGALLGGMIGLLQPIFVLWMR